MLLLVAPTTAQGSDPGHRYPPPLNHECDSGPFSTELWKHCGEFPESLPMAFRLNASGAPASLGGGLTQAVQSAVAAWDLDEETPTFTFSGSTARTPGSKDGVNVIGFGDPATCQQPGAAAVACLWFKSSAGPGRHQIVETDIILSATETWLVADGMQDALGGVSGSLGLATASWFDVQEFVTHELGHAIGLDDLGNPNGINPWPQTLSDTGRHLQTMYRYAFRGSTSKRSLEFGDRLGLSYVHESS